MSNINTMVKIFFDLETEAKHGDNNNFFFLFIKRVNTIQLFDIIFIGETWLENISSRK